MKLNEKDAIHFYDLYLPLLNAVSVAYDIYPEAWEDLSRGVDIEKAYSMADYLWNHREILDDYLDSGTFSVKD